MPRPDAVAVIGIGCRFPGGVTGPDEFWDLLANGVDTIREVPPDRWNVDAYYDPVPATPARTSTRCGGFLDAVDTFDCQFFGISPREAAAIDPQQRLFLEVAVEALERAGQPLETLRGSNTGVFAGVCNSDYLLLHEPLAHPERITPYMGTGNAFSFTAGRLSYVLDLQGPSLAIDTACSSSLVAVHAASQSLKSGECDLAIAGGVNLILSPVGWIYVSQVRAVSPDGRCKPFDAAADGYARSEGCGIVVLKRLRDAERDGDPIVAILRGSAVNHDGRSAGLTAPSGRAQERLIAAALRNAGVTAAEISYVEAHGTGTPLGDPIEMHALSNALCGTRDRSNALVVGSVKANIGHLESAAGIAGLIKVLLALRHREIPAQLHFTRPSAQIDWHEAVSIARTHQPWHVSSRSRIGGVSSFGFAGTNAHVVVEEAPVVDVAKAETAAAEAWLLPVSGRSAEAVAAASAAYARYVEAAEAAVAEVSYTACCRRSHHAWRRAVVGRSGAEWAAQLRAGGGRQGVGARVVWVFSGQGGQWSGMGQDLWAREPAYRQTLAACAAAVAAETGWDLPALLAAEVETLGIAETQVAIFAVQVGLAGVWQAWGVTPWAVVGHSMGEVAAAVAAGVLPLADGVRVITTRGRLLATAAGAGAMAAVDASAAQVEDVVMRAGVAAIELAADNGPAQAVISGPGAAVQAAQAALAAAGIESQRLRTHGVAGHSAQMTALVPRLEAALAGLRGRPGVLPLVSTVTGAPRAGETIDAAYWGANLRAPVQFAAAARWLAAAGAGVWVEVGPQPVLTPAITTTVAAMGHPPRVVASLRRDTPARPTLLQAAAAIYEEGGTLHWPALAPARGRVVPLPTYPWQRSRHWIENARENRTARLLTDADLVADPKLRHTIDRLLDQHPSEGSRAVNMPLLAPEIFLSAAANAFIFVRRGERSISTFAYVGPDTSFRAVIEELRAFGRIRGLSLNILARPHQLDALTGLTCSATPIGIVQSLPRLEAFSLDGRRMRRLRHLVNRYRESDDCETAEWTPGRDRTIDRQVLRLIDTWSASKRHTPACVQRVGDAIRAGEMLPATRMFLTTRDGRADAMVVLSAIAPGTRYLMDLEFYDPAGPAGCVEHTIVAVIDRLRAEDAISLSLGGTFGTRADADPRADATINTFFATLHDRGVLNGDGNVQFKRKFDPEETPLYLARCEPAAEADLSDLLRLFSDSPDATTTTHALIALSREHRVDGVGVVPGAAFVALAIDALSHRATRPLCAFEDVRFERPLTVGDDAPGRIECAVRVTGDGEGLEVIGRDASRTDEPATGVTHLRARVSRGMPRASGMTLDHARRRCGAEYSAAEFYAQAAHAGIGYGPSVRPLSRLWRGDRAALGSIALPPSASSAAASATLIEGALQTMSAAVISNRAALPRPYLVRRIEAIHVHEALTDHLTAFATVSSSTHSDARGDLIVFNTDGRIVMEMNGVEAVAVRDAALIAPYTLQWNEQAPTNDAVAIDHWLVIGDGPLAAEVSAAAAAAGGSTTVVGDAADPTACAAVVAQWAAAHPGCRAVIHLGTEDRTAGDVALVVAAHVEAAVRWGQAVVTAGGSDTRLWLVTQQGQAVQRHEAVAVDAASVWGWARVLAAEHPEVWGGVIDVGAADAVGAAVVAEVTGGGRDAVAYRGGRRLVPRLARAARPPARAVPVARDGAYLITGGLGGVGQQVAAWLIAQGARDVVLVTRRGGVAPAALTATGARVEVVAADVSDAAAVHALVTAVGARTRLRGVVHAAGVVDDSVVLRQTGPALARVLAPKVRGAWHLHEATAHLPLDWFVLFSSAAAFLGPASQGAHAAACAGLDAIAYHRASAGLPALTINWGVWAETGLAADRGLDARIARQGIVAFSPAEALQLFGDWLGHQSAPQLVALSIDWPLWLQHATSQQTALFAHHSGVEADAVPRPVDLDAYLATQIADMLTLPILEINPDTALNLLGFDSLMAIELKTRIARDWGVGVPILDVLQDASLNRLQAGIRERMRTAPTPSVRMSALLPRIDSLSEPEIDHALATLQRGSPVDGRGFAK